MKKTTYGVMKTIDGITIHYVQDPGQNRKPHNLNGPAMIYADGKEEYYINGLKMIHSQFLLISKKRVYSSVEEEA
jgi:hypothetical protein